MFFPLIFGGPEPQCPIFSDSTLSQTAAWQDVQYHSTGKFAVCGWAQATSQPTITYTDDYGATWHDGVGASTSQQDWNNLALLGTRMLCVSVLNGTKVYQSSTDVINWSGGSITGITGNQNTPTPWTGLIADSVNGRYVLLLTVNDNANGGNTFYTSDDDTGVAWTRRNLLPSNNQWKSIACNTTNIVTIGVDTSGADSNLAAYRSISEYTSNTWHAATLPSSGAWRNVVWTGTCFFATTRFSTSAARSYDGGATWEAVTLPTGLNNNPISCNPATGKLYLLITDHVATPNYYYTSTDDGTTWSSQCSVTAAAWGMLATDDTGTNLVMTTCGNASNWTNKAGYFRR